MVFGRILAFVLVLHQALVLLFGKNRLGLSLAFVCGMVVLGMGVIPETSERNEIAFIGWAIEGEHLRVDQLACCESDGWSFAILAGFGMHVVVSA